MLNGWLLYQTLACRVWARSAFYQASGAYGFRDQLAGRDGAIGVTPADDPRTYPARGGAAVPRRRRPALVAADSGQGVRTRISDDRAWLAFAAAHYVAVTGDAAVLDESVPFLEGPTLEPGEHEASSPAISHDGSLFEHCARALDGRLADGGHGLPLIGDGDWNDGMNRVGAGARRKRLARLVAACDARAVCAARRSAWRACAREELARPCGALQASLEREALGRRMVSARFFRRRNASGLSQSDECRIDCIAQSWAALSAAASPERAAERWLRSNVS